MLRARRALATVASGSSAAPTAPLRLVRRLHHRTVASSSSPLLAASAPVSRFSAGGATTRAFVTLQRRRSALSPAVSVMQLRWRSALSDEQHGKLAQHMAELAACRDNGNWRQALKLLDRIDKEGFALDAEMYELAMAACARMGKIEVLPGLLQNMEVDALLPTNRTIDFVMQAYIAAEEWKLIVKLAKEVTAKGVPLSDAAFQAAFESCGKMRDATSARQILLNAEAAGSLELDPSHYAAAIRACGMGGRADLAAGLFAHMEEKRGIEADADVFNHLIRAQIVNGALPQALQTFTTVNERPDVEMPESIYTATIDALVSEGEFWQATQLFGQMVAHDLSPSVFCYGRMMVAYVRLNKHELARECWQRVLAINEPSPSLTKYAKMVTQLSTTNDSELATAIFEHIFPLYDPAYIRDTTYAAAIRAYGRLGRTQTAVDLFDTFVANRRRVGKPLPRSAGIYLAVFNALSRDTEREPKQNSRDAQRVWDIMVESVPVVMAPAYASLAGVFASSGDLSTLDELMEHAEESMKQQAYSARRGGGRPSHYNNYSSAFDELEQDQDDEVFDGEDEAAFDGEIVGGAAGWRDELLYNGVISGFSKARSDQSQRVMDYLETMRARGMKITDSVVRASTDTFVKHAQWGRMFELMDFVDVRALQNADVCFGDTISKLLEAQAWEPARFWIARAHRLGVQPPIRGKMEVLRALREDGSHEWQIAYALARETLSFKQMVQDNIESVADAVDVCARAGRTDLVVKLFERTASHASLARHGAERGLKLPLRMYKQTLLACMREHSTTPDFGDQDPDGPDAGATPIQKAEAICAQMLQAHAAKPSSVSSDEALDGAALSLAISIKATMGDDDDVLALFEKMQQHGLAPNSYAYNAAIMAYSRAKRIDRVLAVRDALLEHDAAILREPKVTQSLLFSLAILHDDAAQREHLAATRALLPHVANDHVVAAFLQANRLDKCVEYYDETTSSELFYATLRRLLDGPRGHHKASAVSASSPSHAAASQGDAVRLGAALLLKHIAFHGLDSVKPPGLVLRVTKQLVQAGALREAHAILSLFSAPGSELSLADMKPAFQKDALELLLFIHGEQRSFDALGELFDKQAKGASAVPLHVRHYQLAMEYCVPARDALASLESSKKLTKKQKEEIVAQGATACLKLFETLRMQFVKPNGAVYALALQSCHRLGRLDVTGARVLGDAVDQGFGYLLASELYRLASAAVHERRVASEAALSGDETEAPRRGRKASKPASAPKVDVAELAAVALFAHHGGVPISWRLGKKLLELGAALPKNVRNELAYIVEAAEAAYAARAAETAAGADGSDQSLTATASVQTATRATRAAQPAPRKAAGASTAKAGARWGELYLQKLPSDE